MRKRYWPLLSGALRMNLIAIDTSTEMASVALSVGTDVYSLEQVGVRQHAQLLLPMIQTLMQTHQMTWSMIQGIVFGSGPGSFTGLRISCSIAQALAYAHSLPIFGIRSMDAIAYQARILAQAPDVGILAMGDARMQEVYWAYYPPSASCIDAEVRVGPVQTVQVLEGVPFVLAGWGLDAYHAHWSDLLQDKWRAHYAMYPKAETLIRIVQTGVCRAVTAAEALPLYVRNNVTGAVHG